MRHIGAMKAVLEHVAGWVHPSVADDALASARHRAFLLSHILGGVAPFAALPGLLASGHAASPLELAAFCWLLAPILIALNLSRSGDLVRAHTLSALSIVVLVVAVSLSTGGLASIALPWLVLAPLEAGLSGSRRAVGVAIVAAAGAVALLLGLNVAGLTPTAEPVGPVLTALGVFGASVCALALALRAAESVGEGDALSRAGRARFELFAGAVSDLVTRHAPDGTVTFASPAAAGLLGVAPRELVGRGLFDRIHIGDRPAFLHALAAATRGAETTIEIRARRAASGEGARSPEPFVWLEMRARPAPADLGDAPVLAAFRDVSDRKAHEEALLAARQDADRASLAKTRFLATMSHELRTPLNAIIGFSEILTDERLCRLEPARRSDYAALIHQSGLHLLDVVNGILDMSKIETGCFAVFPEPCEVGPVVEHCLGMVALKAEAAGVRLAAEVAPGLPPVVADPRALTQMALNLLSNAIKFTPRGGAVTLEAQASGRVFTLAVRDTGCGIAPEHINRLGEAFFQASGALDRPHEGSGLGLSVVRGLVELHGGRLAIESVVDRGTKVSVHLPLGAASAPRGGRATLDAQEMRQSA
ncbi:PAS domain-containing sensor histidine kinase [Methylopila capsulata]|uniref:histidine kinase n=2 Tax=Methylopila capsulata TaxID=61654 RepID=A0A9W6ITG1_9HYPH|nr:PAS domain-containing sensor histidine kinase [Methylopila capsulata]